MSGVARFAWGALLAGVAVFIAAPIVVVVVSSFTDGQIPEFPPTHWSLRWYRHAFEQSLFMESLRWSLVLAASATLANVPIAIAAALAIARGRFPGREFVQTLLLSPLIVPAIVIGLALLLAFASIGHREPTTRLLVAHVLITLPYMVRVVLANLVRMEAELEEAALTLGAGRLRAFFHVTLPLLAPGLFAGALFSFIVSFDNVSVSLFLTTAKVNTLPVAILNYVEYNLDPSIAAISTVLVLLSLGVAVVLERLVGLSRVVGN